MAIAATPLPQRPSMPVGPILPAGQLSLATYSHAVTGTGIRHAGSAAMSILYAGMQAWTPWHSAQRAAAAVGWHAELTECVGHEIS